MATETGNRMTGHLRSVSVTTIASLAGVLAGVASEFLANGPTDMMGPLVAIAFAMAGLGVMRVVGIDVEDFGAKDHLYVLFMTVALWFVTWGILLTSAS